MKILQVINNLSIAGAEVLVHNLLLGLTGRGIHCELYLLDPATSPLQDSLVRNGITIHAPQPRRVRSPLHVRALSSHFRKHPYDVIHAHLFPTQLWIALAARSAHLRTPRVTTEHSPYNYRRRLLYRPLDRWMYSQYDAIACVTDDTAKSLVAWAPAMAGKVRTCLNGIYVDRFRTAEPLGRAALGVPENCPIVLSVGRLVHPKDHATTIRALQRVDAAHLVIVGSGPDLAAHQALARSLGVGARVHFLAARSDIPQVMKSADIFVQSSRFEGFGIAALEAMASGIPVIASRVAGLTELVGDAALLFDSGDDATLAAHLNAALQNPAARADLVLRGSKRADSFNMERTIDAYEALYETVMQSAGSGRHERPRQVVLHGMTPTQP